MPSSHLSSRFPALFLWIAFSLLVGLQALTAADPQSFESWLAANEIPEERMAPTDRNGPLALTNVEAYAFGVNPYTAVSSDLPRLTGATKSEGLRILYQLNTGAQDLEWFLKESTGITSLDWTRVIPLSQQVLWTENGVEGREILVEWDGLSPKLVRIEAGLAGESTFVRVEGGTMPEYTAIGPLDVADFSISQFQVTWTEWLEVREWAVANGYDLNDIGSSCSGNHPVQTVNWYDVVKWCNARSEMEGLTPAYTVSGEVYRELEFDIDGSLAVEWNQLANGYRLLTEAEWEYAARGGQETNNFIYSGSDDLNEVGWYYGNSGGAECALDNGVAGPTDDLAGTWPVGQKAPNELGVYDMSGNVWEWCWDPSPYNDQVRGRKLRGGSWLFGECLIFNRNSYQPIARHYYVGFRLARN